MIGRRPVLAGFSACGRRFAVVAAVVGLVLCLLLGVVASLFVSSARAGRALASASASASAAGIQLGAPYPADVEHLDQILAIGKGHALPGGAQVVSVEPAAGFAQKYYPRAWGYVIAFTADAQSIRDYLDEHNIFSGSLVDTHDHTTRPSRQGLEDIDLSTVLNPWDASCFADAVLLLERPLGRAWLVILSHSR